jgi:3-hydroxyacyl-CoA dehydrogenase
VSAAAGLSVTLVDASAAACANGVGMIKKSLERQHKKAAEKDGASAEVWRAGVLYRHLRLCLQILFCFCFCDVY